MIGGPVDGLASGVEAGAVHAHGALLEAGGQRSPAQAPAERELGQGLVAGHHHRHARGRIGEQDLELVTGGDGETGGDDVGEPVVEMGQGLAQPFLDAAPVGEAPGAADVGDGGQVGPWGLRCQGRHDWPF